MSLDIMISVPCLLNYLLRAKIERGTSIAEWRVVRIQTIVLFAEFMQAAHMRRKPTPIWLRPICINYSVPNG